MRLSEVLEILVAGEFARGDATAGKTGGFESATNLEPRDEDSNR